MAHCVDMGLIFISYRREDNNAVVMIHDRLRKHLRGRKIFLDQASLPPGERYPDKLRQALDNADVLVAMIGPKWPNLFGGDPDWVRYELNTAFQRGIHVLPVLLTDTPDDARMPTAAELPDDLRSLVGYGYFEVSCSQRRVADDVAGLAGKIRPLAKPNRMPWSRAIVVAVAVLLGVAGLLVALRPWSQRSPETVVGTPVDPTRIDPCDFAQPAMTSLGPFGQTNFNAHAGNFNRCDVYVEPPNDLSEVDVEFQLREPDSSVGGPVATSGSVTIERDPLSSDGCDRVLRRTTTYAIDVTAKYTADDGRGSDLCQMAEAAAGADVSVLNSHQALHARNDPSWSLGRRDACRLVDATALTPVGVAPNSQNPGFGNWACSYAGDLQRSVTVEFDQGEFKPFDGLAVQIGQYRGHEQPDRNGGQSCTVVLRYHQIDNSSPTPWEMVDITVDGTGTVQLHCQRAEQLANNAATHLP